MLKYTVSGWVAVLAIMIALIAGESYIKTYVERIRIKTKENRALEEELYAVKLRGEHQNGALYDLLSQSEKVDAEQIAELSLAEEDADSVLEGCKKIVWTKIADKSTSDLRLLLYLPEGNHTIEVLGLSEQVDRKLWSVDSSKDLAYVKLEQEYSFRPAVAPVYCQHSTESGVFEIRIAQTDDLKAVDLIVIDQTSQKAVVKSLDGITEPLEKKGEVVRWRQAICGPRTAYPSQVRYEDIKSPSFSRETFQPAANLAVVSALEMPEGLPLSLLLRVRSDAKPSIPAIELGLVWSIETLTTKLLPTLPGQKPSKSIADIFEPYQGGEVVYYKESCFPAIMSK